MFVNFWKKTKDLIKTVLNLVLILFRLDVNQQKRFWEGVGKKDSLDAEQVDGCFSRHKELRPVLDWYLEFVWKNISAHFKNGKILDYGCGTGRYLDYLGQRGSYDLYGIDFSDTTIEKFTKKRNVRARILSADLTQDHEFVHANENSFNAIYSISVIQLITPSNLRKLIRSFSRLLVPGGILILNFPHPNDLLNFVRDLSYVRYFPAFLERSLRRKGFEVLYSGTSVDGRRIAYFDKSTKPNNGYWIKVRKLS